MATADASLFYYETVGRHYSLELEDGEGTAKFLVIPDIHFRRLFRTVIYLAVAQTYPGVNFSMTRNLGSWLRGKLLRCGKYPVWHLSFSPDGNRLLAAGWSGDILVWDLKAGGPPRVLAAHHLTAWSAEFSPDGKVIATTGSDQTVRLWDSASLEPLAELHGHASEVWCAAFSPDGKTLATGGKDCTVRLWSASPDRQPDAPPEHRHRHPIFSPDGEKIITFCRTWRRWGAIGIGEFHLLASSLQAPSFARGASVAGLRPDGAGVVSFDAAELKLKFWDWNGSARRLAP